MGANRTARPGRKRCWSVGAAATLALTALLIAGGCDREDNDWAGFDPGAKHVVFATDTLRVGEGAEPEGLRISLGMVPNDPVSVVIEADTGQVTVDPDTLVFLPVDDEWAVVKTVVVQAVEDAVDEGDHADALSVTVVSADVAYDGQGGRSIVPVLVTDNDGAGVAVSETLLTLVESLDGTISEYYDLVLESQPTDEVTLTLDVLPLDPTLHVEPATVVFGVENWNTTQRVRLWIELDDIDGDDFDAVLSHESSSADPNYGSELDVASVDLIVLDDTAPPTARIEFTDSAVPDGYTLYESDPGRGIDVVISLDRRSDEPISLRLATEDKTTFGDVDYVALDEEVVFAPGDDLARVFTVSVINDAVLEFPEEFEVVITAAENLVIGSEDRLTIAVEDDDTTELTMEVASVNEDTGAAEFHVGIPRAEMVPLEFTFVTSDLTATAGVDYEAVDEIFTIEPGYTQQIIPVVLLSDQVLEPDESFTARLESLSRHATWSQAPISCTILNDDSQGFVLTGGEFSESDGHAAFTLTMDVPYYEPVEVVLNVLSGDGLGDADGQEDAQPTSDYGIMTGALRTIPAGQTSWEFEVDLVGDFIAEAREEYFRLEIAGADQAGFAGLVAIATIIDDDLPCVAVTDVVVDESDPEAVFHIELQNGVGFAMTSTADVVFTATTVDQSAQAGADYVAVTETVTIPAGTDGIDVPVTLLDDAHDDDDETFQLLLASPFNAESFCPAEATFCRIVDDEYPTLDVVAIDGTRYNEGSDFEFVVRLTTPRQYDTTFLMNLSAGTSNGLGVDYSFTDNGTWTIPAYQTEFAFAATFLDDQETGEPDEIIVVNIGNANVALGVDHIEATIVDAPVMEIADTTANEGETAYFPVTLDAVSTADVRFSVQFADGTATAGADFPVTGGGPFTIPAGSLTTNVPVPITGGDGGDSSTEIFLVTLVSPVNATLGATTSAVGTIYDMDPPQLSWGAAAGALEGEDVPLIVNLSWTSEVAIQFELVFTAGTAAGAGIDYDDSNTGPYTIAPGAVNYVVPVPTVADGAPELSAEDFTVTLVSPTEAVIGSPDTVTGTILDADQPVLTIPTGDTAVEGDDLHITVQLDRATIVPVGFALIYGAGTTQGAADFDPTQTGPFSLAPGTTDTTFVISTVSDAVAEPQEIFTVRLADDTVNAVLGDPYQAEGVIDDDD